MIPADFVAEAKQASAANDSAKLKLLELEVEGLPWQREAAVLLATQVKPKPQTVDRLILFTGHRIDAPARGKPRFPASAEGAVKEAIRHMVSRQMGLADGAMLAVAGGANGGDILFLEVCREMGVPIRMLLALPPDQFIPASVETESGGAWVERFKVLLEAGGGPVLAQDKTLPKWLAEKPGYDFWQRNNMWLIAYALARAPKHFVVAALWDGEEGDGPGGTGNMVATAQKNGAEFVWLDSQRIVGG
jgi:hypothetical protein